MLLYLVLNVLYVYSMPVPELAALKGSVMDVIAERLFGAARRRSDGGDDGHQHRGQRERDDDRGPPRLLRDGARRRCSSGSAAEIHPRYGTPSNAILAQSAWSVLLVLSGSFKQLIIYTGFSVVLFSGIAGVALFVLRLAPSRRAAAVSRVGLSR